MLEESFEDLDFASLGFLPDTQKSDFLAALAELRGFAARGFDFDRLCRKVAALLRYDGESSGLIHRWIYRAVVGLAGASRGSRYGEVLGTAGMISGIYEVIFRQNTPLAGIKLGPFAEFEMRVRDENGIEVKEFDAVSTEKTPGGNSIVTVFEFKFALSLRKLYEQVIGIDSARVPHLLVLTRYEQFRGVKNLVYFGEVGDGHITTAMREFVARTPSTAARVSVTAKGYAVKLTIPEVGEFLCDQRTIELAQRAGSLGLPGDTRSPAYRGKIRRIRSIIARKVAQERQKEQGKFDVIVAVSNAPRSELSKFRQLLRRMPI